MDAATEWNALVADVKHVNVAISLREMSLFMFEFALLSGSIQDYTRR